MIGAIAGDVIGSVHELGGIKSVEFPLFHPHCRFTDDTVLTIATAYAILRGTPYQTAYRDFGRQHPDAGYGGTFYRWLMMADPRPYNSWGNGSAMRVSPVAWVALDEAEVLSLAAASALPTHNHPRGVIGAQAVALAIWLARQGATRGTIAARGAAVRRCSGWRRKRGKRRSPRFREPSTTTRTLK